MKANILYWISEHPDYTAISVVKKSDVEDKCREMGFSLEDLKKVLSNGVIEEYGDDCEADFISDVLPWLTPVTQTHYRDTPSDATPSQSYRSLADFVEYYDKPEYIIIIGGKI